ncbi:GntR family transcriptional regulator [Nocardioides kongjuensis]|uniref:DNA-binding GntR family transcriptional regulator n=1 Tax=Nocardioides kongjuensis TaxID=349522 RepID=A0A852RIJ6_9ACTN|nr:GntR family transcriptional regulator [Nocardioides kongjuensis]NYD28690.1 DNA-binding GntR family transcriptional regulator [Nocardioides kongjuensis]
MATAQGRRSLAVQAFERIKGEIVSLQRPPGQRLVERDLAAELEISRIPLREALRQLEAEGLVVIVPRQGAMVAPFTAADVRHLFDVRESLEVLAVRLAAQQADSRGLATLQGHLAAAHAALAARDLNALADANAGFHETVIAMSANPLLQSIMQPLNARVRWLFHLAQGPDEDDDMCAEHEAIYRAIAAGDAERGAALAYEHVRETREATLEMAAGWTVPDLDPVAVTRTRQRERRS